MGYSKGNKMHVKSIFSVESIKIMGSWYVMQWCLTMVELDIFHHQVRRKELSYPDEGSAVSSKLFGFNYQTSWSHIP